MAKTVQMVNLFYTLEFYTLCYSIQGGLSKNDVFFRPIFKTELLGVFNTEYFR